MVVLEYGSAKNSTPVDAAYLWKKWEKRKRIPRLIILGIVIIFIGFCVYRFRNTNLPIALNEVKQKIQMTYADWIGLHPNPSGKIQINGDKHCQDKIQSALQYLLTIDKHEYDNVVRYVAIIQCGNEARYSFMEATKKPPVMTITKSTLEDPIKYLSSTLVHETCHSMQFNNRITQIFMNLSSVPLRDQKNIEAECYEKQYEVLIKMEADKYMLDFVHTMMSTDNWRPSMQDKIDMGY